MSRIKLRELIQQSQRQQITCLPPAQPKRPEISRHPAPPKSKNSRAAGAQAGAATKQVAQREALDAAKRALVQMKVKNALKNGAEKIREALLRDKFETLREKLPELKEIFNKVAPAPVPTVPTTDPVATPPVPQQSLSYDGGVTYQPEVEALQHNLVAAGYMTEEEMATGPGYYGPRTKAAVARMQADYGIASDGSIYGPQSRAALSQAVTKGGVTTPGESPAIVPGTPGTPGESPAIVPGAPANTVETPNGTPVQTADVPLINQQWPDGATSSNYWNGNANCGPTSAAMVARAFGLGEGLSDAELVMQLYRTGGTTENGSGPWQVKTMVESLGLPATFVEDPGLAELDAAIDAGKLVIVNGDYNATGAAGRNGALESGHFCVVSGKDENGNYIIHDPWGPEVIKFTPQTMSNFFREHDHNGAMVVVDKVIAKPEPVATTTPTAPVAGVDGIELSPADEATAERVDALLATYEDSAMHGMGRVIVAACRRERVPLDLVLAQLGKESTFLRSDNTLSIANNNAANLRFAEWERAFGGEPGVGGFTRFPSVADGINAYVHLLGSPDLPYREMVDRRDWESLVNLFAPASDGNDVATYVAQINEWTRYFADKIGIDENWVNTAAAA